MIESDISSLDGSGEEIQRGKKQRKTKKAGNARGHTRIYKGTKTLSSNRVVNYL